MKCTWCSIVFKAQDLKFYTFNWYPYAISRPLPFSVLIFFLLFSVSILVQWKLCFKLFWIPQNSELITFYTKSVKIHVFKYQHVLFSGFFTHEITIFTMKLKDICVIVKKLLYYQNVHFSMHYFTEKFCIALNTWLCRRPSWSKALVSAHLCYVIKQLYINQPSICNLPIKVYLSFCRWCDPWFR